MTTSKNTTKISQLAKKQIAVEIKNGNQEKEFRHLCLMCGEPLIKKDETAYRADENGKKKAIYPIYYGFVQLGDRRTTWWTTDKQQALDQNYLLVGMTSFKEMIGEQL